MANKIAKLTMLTVLFSTALGFGLTSVSEINSTSTPTKQAVSYASGDDLNDHDTDHSSDDGWASFSDSNGGSLTGGSNESKMAYYYLSGDITLINYDITIIGYVTLCLNGKTLTGTGDSSVIFVDLGAYFNLCDCSGDDSGIITNGSTSNGGGIYMDRASDTSYSTFNMYGGTISGNTGSDGGGVYVNQYNIFNMYGGVISDNTASFGGGVYTTSTLNTINIYGGTISGNTAADSDTVGIYSSGTLNIYGGYLGDSFIGDIVSINGGYFSSTAYDSIKNYVADGYKIIASGDTNWPYVVVYTTSNNHTHGSDWIPLEQDDFGSNGDYASGTLAGGSSEIETKYYYLDEDVTLSTNDITISDYVTLCLNGKTLTGTGDSSVIFVDLGAYFNLCDCSGDDSGKITGAKTVDNQGDGGVNISRSTFNMYGGTISGNIAGGYAGGVKLEDSVFNMYGGTISSNEAENGGGVYATRTTFNMYGGTISNNKASNGSGVCLSSSTFNMYDGTITKNTDEWLCGGVYLTVDSTSNDIYSTFNMYNGTISENESSNMTDGIRITSNCSFYMYGGYLDNDVYEYDGSISITGGYLSTTAYNSINDEDYIPTGYIAKEIEDDTWKYIVVDSSHSDSINSQTIEFDTYLDELTYKTSTSLTLSGGNYYLATDLNLDVTISGTVYLCLNGKTLEGTGSDSVINLTGGAILTLCDCSSDDSGTITGGNAAYGAGVCNNGIFNMYGGTISGNTASYGGGVCNNGTFNMYGGTISGNESNYDGGGVYVYNEYRFDYTFNMYNGTISNNTAEDGGGLYISGRYATFNMYGGYFDNDMYIYNASTVSIKGGYFSSSIYESIKDYIDNDSIGLNISTLGKEFDNNYLEEYPYAVYYAKEYSVEDITIIYGTTYTPIISDAYTNVIYTWINEDSNTGTGLPTEIGEYTVTAHFLYTTTEGYITTNSYGTTEFKVTIIQSSSSTPSDGEDGTDNNSSDDGTTTSSDSTSLSAGAIAGIVIASVFIVGLITFLVYFLFFRKRRTTSSK